MKILIFLFAMITFILMASDPRRDYFEQGDSTARDKQDNDQLKPEQKKEDSEESS